MNSSKLLPSEHLHKNDMLLLAEVYDLKMPKNRTKAFVHLPKDKHNCTTTEQNGKPKDGLNSMYALIGGGGGWGYNTLINSIICKLCPFFSFIFFNSTTF